MPPKVAQIPIKKDEDATYRYKMPRLASSRLSSGNGVKTAIINSSDICKAISRTQLLLQQWFGYSLACQSKINPTSGQIVLNGDHQAKKLLDSLYEFIDNFILCPNCSNPETTMDKKGNQLVLHCHACGHTEPAGTSKSNNIQKTTDWILSHIISEQKQPQNVTVRSKGRIDEIDEFQKQAESELPGSGIQINIEELEAIQKQLEKVTEQKVEKLTEKEETDFLNNLPSKLYGDIHDSDLFNEFNIFAERGGYNSPTRALMIIDLLLTSRIKDTISLLIHRRGFLIRFLTDEKIQIDFLNTLSKYVEVTHPELLTSSPIIWYTLFDNEIIEESAFKAWQQRPNKRFETTSNATKIREILQPFYQWMENAEFEQIIQKDLIEEEDEEEEEEFNENNSKEQKELNDFIDDI